MRIPNTQNRPRCTEPGCNRLAALIKDHKDGYKSWRLWCSHHHNRRTGALHDIKNITEVMAKKKNMTVSQYVNSKHRYKKYRETYCENQDGRLGFKCTATIEWIGMLQVDHINGIPNDDRRENLQTLCANCHAWKSNHNKDYASPGRKTLKKVASQKILKPPVVIDVEIFKMPSFLEELQMATRD